MGIYNCESTLKESIESIINQTYTNWELIMCDDCSKDNTFNVAKEYKDKYPEKIKLIKNEKNITLGPTLNRCIELADGKYIARQDGDDLSVYHRLEKQVKFLEENNKFDLVSSAMSIFDENGEYGIRKLKSEPEGKDLMKGSVFAHATVVIKTEVMKSLNGYSQELTKKQVEDYDLWFRFFEKGYRGYCLEDVLYNVREDRDAYKRKSINRRINEIRVMIEGCKRLKLPVNNYIMIAKPMIAAIIPQKILMQYHRNKFKLNN
ncbi:putative glycosyltransferase EpsE [bioreactor metagenome]|uniref:Putative glycosyltransferase EpsE n=1 Tax=bioreactor metagenome TaxID=1076179 RepID=A0A645FKN4_9ZZZZ